MRTLVWTLASAWLVLLVSLLALGLLGSPLAAPLSVLIFPLLVASGYALPWRVSAIALVAASLLLTALGPDSIPAHLSLGGGLLPAGVTTLLVGGVLLGLGLAARLAQRHARQAGQAEALRAANVELEAFAYTVAHDLRAPLRAIRAYAAALREDHDGDLALDVRESLDRIAKAEADMTRLIDRLLSFAQASGQQLTWTRVDMQQLANKVAGDLRAGASGRELTIRVGELPPAMGDEVFLREALQNLMGNAVKYSRTRAQPIVDVGWTPEQGGAYFVRDNGVGFDMQDAGQLFRVFRRLHDPKRFEGSGAGLAITQRIVTRHGGRIWADAAVERGATFYFTLPQGPPRRARWAAFAHRSRAARASRP